MNETLRNKVSEITVSKTNKLIKEALPRMLLRDKFEKSSTSAGSCRDDAFFKRDHDEHQGDDATLEGKKSGKRKKISKSSKSARGSSSKQPDPVIDEDEVILEDETLEILKEFQNVDKRVPTIFDRERMKATLRDMLSNHFRDAEEYAYHLEQSQNYMENQIRNLNEPPRYLYNKDLFFLKYGNTKEKRDVLSLYKIHVVYFLEEDLEEKLIRKNEKRFMDLEELSKFCDATLEKDLKEVKLKIFET
ncbi:hypothetical protein Tco_1390919 [Tanacetum coccineum]